MQPQVLCHSQGHPAQQPRHWHGIDTGLESSHQCERLNLMQADVGDGGVPQNLRSPWLAREQACCHLFLMDAANRSYHTTPASASPGNTFDSP